MYAGVPSTLPACESSRFPTAAHGRDQVVVGYGPGRRLSLTSFFQDLGESPVHNLDLAERAHHDVGRLQVTVDDAARVGIGHRLADGFEDREKARQIAWCGPAYRVGGGPVPLIGVSTQGKLRPRIDIIDVGGGSVPRSVFDGGDSVPESIFDVGGGSVPRSVFEGGDSVRELIFDEGEGSVPRSVVRSVRRAEPAPTVGRDAFDRSWSRLDKVLPLTSFMVK